MNNIRLSEVDGKPYVLSKNFEYPDFFKAPYAKKRRLRYEGEELGATYKKSRSNMWNYVDWDGDGDQGYRRGHRHMGRLRLGQRLRQPRALDPGSAARLRLPARKHGQRICQPRQSGGGRRPDRRLRSSQSVYRRLRRRRRSGPDLRRIRRWADLVREHREPHGAPLCGGTSACQQTRGDSPPSGDDRPGGFGFRRRRTPRPHRRRRRRAAWLGCATRGRSKKACPSSNRRSTSPSRPIW